MQIDSVQPFGRVNHQSILYKLCSVGIGGSVWSMLTQFLLNQSQHIMVDGCWSKLVNVLSGVVPGNILGPLLFLLYTSEIFSILENKPIVHANNSNFIPWVAAQAVRWSGIPKVARSQLTQSSKSCDLQPSPSLQCAISAAQGVLPCVGWGVQPVNWIYRLWCIVRSWLWLTATRSSLLGYFSKLLQVVDNWIHILW